MTAPGRPPLDGRKLKPLLLELGRLAEEEAVGRFLVGLPLDMMVIERDAFTAGHQRRITHEDSYFQAISAGWSDSLRNAFNQLPDYSFYAQADETA